MTRTLSERPGLSASTGNGQPPEPAGFLSAYPGYRGTALLDELQEAEYSYLDADGHVYLDYAGAGLSAQARLAAHAERMRGQCFRDPHSENPASAASTELIERARLAVLAHPDDGSVPRPARHAQRRGAARIGGLGLHRRRRGAVPGLRGADVPGSRDRHRRPGTPAGLLSQRRP